MLTTLLARPGRQIRASRRDQSEVSRAHKIIVRSRGPRTGISRRVIGGGQLFGVAPVRIHLSMVDAASPKSVLWENRIVCWRNW
jgi:hypothetical protein